MSIDVPSQEFRICCDPFARPLVSGDFGLRISFGFRIWLFGFVVQKTTFAALTPLALSVDEGEKRSVHRHGQTVSVLKGTEGLTIKRMVCANRCLNSLKVTVFRSKPSQTNLSTTASTISAGAGRRAGGFISRSTVMMEDRFEGGILNQPRSTEQV